MDLIKSIIDFLSAPTISFTLLTVAFPFIFPPTDWFDKKNRQLGSGLTREGSVFLQRSLSFSS